MKIYLLIALSTNFFNQPITEVIAKFPDEQQCQEALNQVVKKNNTNTTYFCKESIK